MAAEDNKILKWALLILAFIIVMLLLKPFITPLVLAIVVAGILYKLYAKLSTKIGPNASAGLLTALVLFTLFGFIAYGVNVFLNELGQIYQIVAKANLANFSNLLPEISSSINTLVRDIIQRAIFYTTELILSLPKFFLAVFVFAVSLFYFLRDGQKFYEWIKKNIPFPESNKKHLFEGLERYFNAFMKVWLFIGLLQGIVAIIGFLFFDLPLPLLAGLSAAILSILPIVGPFILYLGVGVLLLFLGKVDVAIGFLLYGLTISMILDYIVRPFLAGKWAILNPLLMLIGMLGGIFLFGPAGVIIGPACIIAVLSILHSYGYVNKLCNK
ncbi:MAG: AI-2E family transporter [Candidatus Nanoarchaeia archaeon]